MKTIKTELFFCGELVKYDVPVKTWDEIRHEIEPGSNTLIVKLEKEYVIIDLQGCSNGNLVAVNIGEKL